MQSNAASEDSKPPSKVLAAQLPLWRKFRNGLSAQQLADRIADLDGKLSRVAISEIERGKRRVSLDEALLLAAALNVPPPLLFFPFEIGGHVAVTPKSVIHPDLATRWLAGESWLALTDRTATGTQEFAEARWTEAARPLRLYGAHRRTFSKASDADLKIRQAKVAKDTEAETAATRLRAKWLRELVEVRNEMRAEGMTPPWLEPRWVPDLKRLGEEG